MKAFFLSLTLSFVAAGAGGAYLLWQHHPDRALVERRMAVEYHTFAEARAKRESTNYLAQYLDKLNAKRQVKLAAMPRSRRGRAAFARANLPVRSPAPSLALASNPAVQPASTGIPAVQLVAPKSSLVFDGPKPAERSMARVRVKTKVKAKSHRKVRAARGLSKKKPKGLKQRPHRAGPKRL